MTPEERLYEIPENERSQVLLTRLRETSDSLFEPPKDCRWRGAFADRQCRAAEVRAEALREDDREERTVSITKTIHSGEACRQDDPATVRIF